MAVFDLHEDDTKTRKGIPKELREKHAAALQNFKASASYFSQQRKREVEDLKFYDFDEQWEPTAKTSRAGNQAANGLPPTPPRPTPVVNQLRAPVQQVANTRRAARLALEFAPKGEGSTDDMAEVFEDIVRAIQHESRAAIARNWAADRSEKAGLGWFRLDTEYCEDADPDDPIAGQDQDIVYRRILNQAAVYPDPYAQEPDFSDGRFFFVTEDMPIDVYRETYPDSDMAAMSDGELVAVGDAQPKWVFPAAGEDGEALQTIRIAEYWQIVTRHEARRRPHRQIYHSIINGIEYLQPPEERDGRYVPLIPTVGMESNVDSERRWTGLVRPARDACMQFNVLNAATVETIGLATKAPYMGYMETIEPYLEWWKQSSIRNYFILPLKAAYDKAGNLLPFPKRNVEEPAIQATSMAAATAKENVHIVTGIPPAALGQLDPHDRSGVAIRALQQQSEVGSSGYLGNMIDITLPLEGKILREWIPIYYDRVGRIVPAVGLDDKRRLVMLNAPFTSDADGRPVMLPGWREGMPVPKQIPGPVGPNGQPGPPQDVSYFNLKQGAYSVTSVVGKSTATLRQAASDAIGDVMKVLPPEMNMAIAPAFIASQDWPEAKQIAEILKKSLPPQLAAAYEDDGGGVSPQAKAMIQQLQQQNQQLQQALQTKIAEVQAKGQIDIAKTERDNATKVEIAHIQGENSFAVASLKAQIESINTALAALQAERVADHEARQQRIDASKFMVDTHQQQADRAHELGMAAVDHAATLAQNDQLHQQSLEQGQQAAALAPQPEPTSGASQ